LTQRHVRCNFGDLGIYTFSVIDIEVFEHGKIYRLPLK